MLCLAALLVVSPTEPRLWPLAAATYAGVLAFVLFKLPSHPHPRLGPANMVTLVRAAMVCTFVAATGTLDAGLHGTFFVYLGVLALVLDGVDGRVARRFGLQSELGAALDMEVDALLTLVLGFLLWLADRAGPWVLIAGALRYLWGGAAMLWPILRTPLPGLLFRKTACVVTLSCFVAALSPVFSTPLAHLIAAIGTATVSFSFALDLARLARLSARRA